MGEAKKRLTGRRLAALGIVAIIVIASVGAYWYYYLRPTTQSGIKIGVIGPMQLIQGTGMKEGAILAAEEINAAGGVLVNKTSGEHKNITLVYGDEGSVLAEGSSAVERLVTVDNVDFLVGGFRTEIIYGMREIAMDHKKIFILTGAATDQLLDEVGLPDKYPRYKYMFRVMPLNSTMLFSNALVPFIKYYVLPEVFHATNESKVKMAAVVENLAWTDLLWDNYIGPEDRNILVTTQNGTLVYKARPSYAATDFSAELSAIRDSGAQIIIHVFSGEAGLAFIKQWGEMQIKAVPIGVNVLSQESEMWTNVNGKCEYETFLSTPPKINVTEKTIPFWDKYVQRWEHDPIYTAWGEYDGIYDLKEAIERAGTIDSDAVVAELEKTDRTSLIGRFKFTRTHDVYSVKTDEHVFLETHWITSEYALPMIVQWRSGAKEPVFPFNLSYTKEFKLPPWMPQPP